MEGTTLDPIVPKRPKKRNDIFIITISIALQLGALLFFFFYLGLY